MEILILYFIIFLIPFIFLVFNKVKIANYSYFFKFLIFNFLVIIFNIFYLFFFLFYFIIKNLKFFELFFSNELGFNRKNRFFYKKKFIYFLFWRYIFIYLLKYIFNIIIFFIYNIKNIYFKFMYINNIYVISIILLKIKFIFYNNFLISFYLKFLQFFYMRIVYHLLYILNIDEIYRFLSNFNFFNKNKYKEDPLFSRNYFLKMPSGFYDFCVNLKNSIIGYKLNFNFLNLKNLFLLFIFQILYKYKFYNKFIFIYKFFLKKILLIFMLSKKKLDINIFNKLILFIFYSLYFIIINFIYFLLNILFYLFYFLLSSFLKFKKQLVYLFLIILLFKYIWVINYFLFILYKHYTLYLPIQEIKESYRFFNFEWIDLRNYYNLLIWHNSLVDLSVYNNIIYNDILKNLYNNLSLYGFKTSKFHNIKFNSIYWTKSQWKFTEVPLWKSQISKDTDLLNNLMKKQNKALYLKQYVKYRLMKKRMLNKVKIKFNVGRWNRVYRYYERAHHLDQGNTDLFDNKTAVWNDSIYQKNSYTLLKKILPLKESIKDRLSFFSYYYRGTLRKKISRKCIDIPISKYVRLKHIPLSKLVIQYRKSIHFRNLTKVLSLFNENIRFSRKLKYKRLWYPYYKSLVRKLKILYFKFMHPRSRVNKIYFFKRIYAYNIYKHKFLYKYKIPTYNWVETIWKRRVSKPVFSVYGLLYAPEAFTLNTYHDMAKKNILIKCKFFYKYIFKQYPYRINNYDNAFNINLDYFKLLESGIKIIKKYTFFKSLKKNYYFRFHRFFYLDNKLHGTIILKKLRNWNNPFLHKYFKPYEFKFSKFYKKHLKLIKRLKANLNSEYYKTGYYKSRYTKSGYHKKPYYLRKKYTLRRLKYWNFFDYLKINKYYIYKYKNIYNNKEDLNNFYINLSFIKRFRKDYINYRNYLIRFMSAYFYHEYFRKINVFYKYKSTPGKNTKVIDYRLRWNFSMNLNGKMEKKNNVKFILVLCHLFKKKFKIYNDYLNLKINLYNKIFSKNVVTYKINVLNRISNLKRFFFYRNKHLNGWAILNYINSFSVKFHLKHLLWHSPYSYLFFSNQKENLSVNIMDKSIFNYKLYAYVKENNKINDFLIRLYYVLNGSRPVDYILGFVKNIFKREANYKNIKNQLERNIILYYKACNNSVLENNLITIPISFNKYSLIFNLCLNITDIKEDWSYLMLNNLIDYELISLYNETFSNYYYYGSSNYKNHNILEAYRIFISLLFKYYNNFLYKLSRYLYVLSLKEYTLLKFIKRFFNLRGWNSHFYIKFRILLNPDSLFAKNLSNKFYKKILDRKNKYAYKVRKIEIAPLWFIFYKYIKLFVYFLLNKYYTKDFLIKWWLNYKLNLTYFFKLFLFYYSLKYKFRFKILYNLNYIIYDLNYIKFFILDYVYILYMIIDYVFNVLYPYLFEILMVIYNYYFMEINEFISNFNILNEIIKNNNDFFLNMYRYLFLLIYIIIYNFYDIIYNIHDIICYLYFIKINDFIDIEDLSLLKYFSNLFLFFNFNELNEHNLIKSLKLYLNNKLSLYLWYFYIILKFNIFNYLIKLSLFIDYDKLILFVKLFILKLNFNIKFNFNINNLFFYKFYIKSLLKFYINLLFKVKNNFIYYKSNYFSFRKLKNIKRLKKYKTELSSTFLNVQTRRNYNSFRHLTINNFFLKNLYKFDINTYIYISNLYDIKLNFNLLFTPFIFFKYNYSSYIFFLYWLIYILFLIFIYIFYKKFFNLFFFSKKISHSNNLTEYNWNLFINKKVINRLKSSFKERKLFYNYISKNKYFKNYYFVYIDKLYKHFNKRRLYFESFFILLNNSKYYKNLKKNLNLNNNLLLDISKQKLYLNFPYIYNNKLLKYKRLYNLFSLNFFIYNKENKKYYLSSNNYIYSNNNFYFFIFYWLFLIPLFFIEYIIFRLHLKGHITNKRKLTIFLKIFLDNFKIYVKLIKLLGDQVFHHRLRNKYIKNNLNSYIYRKKKKLKKHNQFFKWDRLLNLYKRMSPMGSYYYWFSHINKWHYFICYYKYFFNSIYTTFYIKYFVIFYLILCFVVYKKYFKYTKELYNVRYKFFNFYKLKNLLNILKYK